MEKLTFLKEIKKKGIIFIASYDCECGTRDLFLSPEQVIQYQNNPGMVIAQSYGLTEMDYKNWKGSEFMVQCSALTKKGSRCKNIVTGGYMVDLEEWVKLSGEHCDLHENGVKD